MEVYGILEVQRTKIEQGNQFQHPPSFHSIYASYFQASSHLCKFFIKWASLIGIKTELRLG